MKPSLKRLHAACLQAHSVWHKSMETLLKKVEILRDEHGRFDRHGKSLAKTAKKRPLNKHQDNAVIAESVTLAIGSGKPGPGRPKGSKNKTSAALREQILAALDKVGGVDYLAKLAIENSSAYASLLGKVLPSTLVAESDGGGSAKIEFRRIIVHPGGREEVEGVTPKSLPAPDASQALPRPTDPTDDTNEGAV